MTRSAVNYSVFIKVSFALRLSIVYYQIQVIKSEEQDPKNVPYCSFLLFI